MKVKLLRKIRKRFAWYKSTTGNLVLIDHEAQRSMIVDAELLKKDYTNLKDEEITETVLFNYLKSLMARPFVENFMTKINYRFAVRRFKSRQK